MSSPSLDEFVERIVREVIRRLLAQEPQSRQEHGATRADAAAVLSQRVITAASIEAVPTGTREIMIAARAILTPLARDEARDRGIRIIRQSQTMETAK